MTIHKNQMIDINHLNNISYVINIYTTEDIVLCHTSNF